MALENGTYVNSLVPANPASTDGLAQADDHIRLIKSTIKNTFPNITGPVTSTQAELDASLPAGHVSYLADLVNTGVTSTEYDYLDGVTSNIQTQIDSIVAGSSNIPQSNIDYLALITGAGVSSTQFGYLSSTTSDIQNQFTTLGGRVTTLETGGTTFTGGTGITVSGSTITCTVDTPAEVGLGNLSSNGNSLSGNFTASGNITAYSDSRLKSDVETIPDALAKVAKMRGVNFTMKDTGARSTGVIAQELQAVIPEAVHTNDDGYLSVAYGNLVGVLIEAINTLSEEVEHLKQTTY